MCGRALAKWINQEINEVSKAEMTDDVKIEEWLAARKREALKIDPQNAEVTWWYAQTLDPYGVDPNLPEECVGRESFARRPGSDIWVWFGDLPIETRRRLEDLHSRRLDFFKYTLWDLFCETI
jgi:hypothetical protein